MDTRMPQHEWTRNWARVMGWELEPIKTKEKTAMSEKTATITKIGDYRTWDNPHGGTVFYIDIALDNGDAGNIGKKTPDAIKVGDQITYTIDDKGKIKQVFNPEGSPQQTQPQQQPQTAQDSAHVNAPIGGSRTASFAIAYAKDIAVAMIAKDKDISSDEILALANKFNQWMQAN